MTRLTLLFIIILTSLTVYGQMKPNWQFRSEYLTYLTSPKDTIYIQDRHKLEKFTGLQYTDSTVLINYTSKAGDKFIINMTKGKFDQTKHKIHLADTVYKFIHNEKRIDNLIQVDLIDNKKSYGIDNDLPKTEIRELKIKWNEKWLSIP